MESSGTRKRKIVVGVSLDDDGTRKRALGPQFFENTISQGHALLQSSPIDKLALLECLSQLAQIKECRESLVLIQRLLKKAKDLPTDEGDPVQHLLNLPVDDQKRTLLHKASAQANLRICALFLQHGASATQTSADDLPALKAHELNMALLYGEDNDDEFGEDSEEGDDDFDADAQSSGDEDDDDEEEDSYEPDNNSTEQETPLPGLKRNGSLLPQEPQKSARLELSPPRLPAAAALDTPPSPSQLPSLVGSFQRIPRSLSSPEPSQHRHETSIPASSSVSSVMEVVPLFFVRQTPLDALPACLDNSDLRLPPQERFPTGPLQRELSELFRLIVFVCELPQPSQPVTVYDADLLVCLAGSGDTRLLILYREHVRTLPADPAFRLEHALVFRSRLVSLMKQVRTAREQSRMAD